MGLAERFKQSSINKDIFTNNQKQYAENPAKASYSNKYEDLETGIISKIRQTPYWQEFPTDLKRKMISAYFTKKLENSNFTMMEREEFVQNILDLC